MAATVSTPASTHAIDMDTFAFDRGLPPDLTYGCIAETMVPRFQGRLERDWKVKDLTLEEIKWTDNVAAKHGFELAALGSLDPRLDDSVIQEVRASADARKGHRPGGER